MPTQEFLDPCPGTAFSCPAAQVQVIMPDRISHYQITGKIGAGGMGEVYLAQDTRLDRMVALKVLPGDTSSNEDRMRRFAQEAKAASSLSHPNVCVIYEVGETEGGQPFIAMEYIEGQTLDSKINGRPLSAREVIDIALQVADALDEAHSKGIVHRDIKPSNLMITPRGQVKVLDFGLAKINPLNRLDSKSDIATIKQTSPGVVMGTVQYMSPEQAIGRATDQRTDIFSLGVVLYEMATGRLPFTGETPSEIIDRINHSQPDAIARLNYEIPVELERIIRKCLEKECDRRYQGARELLIDLKNLKRDSESGAIEAGTPPRKSVDRKWLTISIVMAALAVLAIISFAIFRNTGDAQESMESLVVLPLVNASRDPDSEYLSDGISESIINNLSQLPRLKVLARSTAFRYKGKDGDPQSVGRELGVDAVMTGRLAQHGDQLVVQVDLVRSSDGAQVWGERYNRRMSDIIAVQEEIAKEISARLRLKLSGEEQKLLARRYTESTEAYQLWLKGRYHFLRWTPEGRKKALEYFNEALQKDPAYAPAYAWLSGTYDHFGLSGEMPQSEARSKAKAYAVKALELDDSLAEAHSALGITKWREWDTGGAEKDFRRALELNPKWGDGRDILATFLISVGRLEEALAEADRAQQIDPLSLNINSTRGSALYLLRRYSEAEDQFRKTIELYPENPRVRLNRAWALAQMARYEEAMREAESAISLSGASRDREPILGYIWAKTGKADQTKKIIERLREIDNQESAYALAYLYSALDEKEMAFKYLEKACNQNPGQMSRMKSDPRFDNFRSDARYAKLISQTGTPS